MADLYTLGTEARYDTWYVVDEDTANQLGRTFDVRPYSRDPWVGERGGCYAALLVADGEYQFHVWHPDTPAEEVDEWVRDLADPEYVQRAVSGLGVS